MTRYHRGETSWFQFVLAVLGLALIVYSCYASQVEKEELTKFCKEHDGYLRQIGSEAHSCGDGCIMNTPIYECRSNDGLRVIKLPK